VGLAVTTGDPSPGVLYVLVCGSPIARDVGVLVDLAQSDGWEVCVITTPDGRKFVDVAALQAQTGHPVRSYYKNPGDHDLLPPADAMIVAPATVNTVNKWAAGITDTLVLGLLIEGYGYGVPTVVVPYTNKIMALHPSLHESLAKLRDWGVHVLYGDDVMRLGGPGQNDRFRGQFPWRRALQAVSRPFATDSRVEPGALS
jgi:phosphopantothenoylcysteine decarboxylase